MKQDDKLNFHLISIYISWEWIHASKRSLFLFFIWISMTEPHINLISLPKCQFSFQRSEWHPASLLKQLLFLSSSSKNAQLFFNLHIFSLRILNYLFVLLILSLLAWKPRTKKLACLNENRKLLFISREFYHTIQTKLWPRLGVNRGKRMGKILTGLTVFESFNDGKNPSHLLKKLYISGRIAIFRLLLPKFLQVSL